MNSKTLSIIGGSLFVVAFLLGFVTQYLKNRDLKHELDSTRQELATQGEKLQVDELGLLIGYVYLETSLKNYGLASQSSTTFFNRVRSMEDQTRDTTRRAFLQGALAKRDIVTAGLAKGDPTVVGSIQDLFQAALAATQMASR